MDIAERVRDLPADALLQPEITNLQVASCHNCNVNYLRVLSGYIDFKTGCVLDERKRKKVSDRQRTMEDALSLEPVEVGQKHGVPGDDKWTRNHQCRMKFIQRTVI